MFLERQFPRFVEPTGISPNHCLAAKETDQGQGGKMYRVTPHPTVPSRGTAP